MENDKKLSPVLITIILLLGLCVIGFTIWYVLNYSKGTVVSEEKNKIEEIKKANNLTDEQAKAYSDLITLDGSYGFYFDKKVSIDDISDFNMIIYALNNYVKENKISLENDLTCLDFDLDYCKNVTFPTVKSEKIESYIKNKFNTSREFELTPNNVPDQFIDAEEFAIIGIHNGYCNYNFDKKTYSFGTLATGGMYRKIHTKLSKVEEDGDKLYFYDKAFVEEKGQGYISLMTYLPSETSANDNEFFSYDVEDTKKYNEIKVTKKDGTNYYDIDVDYIFNKYNDKLSTYKHTFKKVNGNYYWVSSEIVK